MENKSLDVGAFGVGKTVSDSGRLLNANCQSPGGDDRVGVLDPKTKKLTSTPVKDAVDVLGRAGDGVAGADPTTASSSDYVRCKSFLDSLWSFERTSHWLTTRNALTGAFQSSHVGSVDLAIKYAAELSQNGFDIYLSPAEFGEYAETRKAKDVVCVRGFWVDIDVGIQKSEKGLGCATLDEAKSAIKAFRKASGLPEPTHVVLSGNGLHAYWIVDAPISPEQWMTTAKLFKELTRALGLLADPSRTADIASLMRFPETFNFKDKANPLPVKLIFARESLIEKSVMLDAIEAAHIVHCGAANPPTPALLKMRVAQARDSSVLSKQWVMVPAQLQKLTSALCVLSPDVEEHVWSLHRIAPLARAARENPDYAIELYLLARRWSSGELRGLPSNAWITPGGRGLTGEQYFDILWKRFLNDGYTSGRTLGSIYFEAAAAGWQE